MKKLSYPGILIVVLGVLILAGGMYLASVGAQTEGSDDASASTSAASNADSNGDSGGGPRPASEIEEAPMIALPASYQPLTVNSFDAEPSDWTREEHTAYPHEFGVWASDSGKLVQLGTEIGIDYTPTMLVAPTEVGSRALISVQVYPQGNPVAGLVFGFTENGYYSFRALAGDASPENPALTYDLNYYDAATDTYRTIQEENTIPGFDTGRWQELRVEFDGDRIVCSFDGQQIFAVTGETVPPGRAGVKTITLADILFDNFIVAQP